LLRAAREINDSQPDRLLRLLMDTRQLRPGDKLAILGAAYKADSEDPRESPAETLAILAKRKGLHVAIHDPKVKGEHGGLKITNDLVTCLKGAAAAALVTEHKAYRHLSSKLFAECMSGRLIADSRNWLNHASLRRAGFTVILLGSSIGESL